MPPVIRFIPALFPRFAITLALFMLTLAGAFGGIFMGWFVKHKIISVILALVVLVIIAGSLGGKSKTSATVDTTTTAPNNQTTKSVSSAPATTSAPAQTVPTTTPATTPPTTVSLQEQNAIQAAQQYLSLGTGFSQVGLIQQLSSSAGDGYPLAIATAAVDSLNVDWNAQAVLAAKGYLGISSFSCSGLEQQLDSSSGSQFTVAQATYAATQVGLC